jgi:hypothetical protein
MSVPLVAGSSEHYFQKNPTKIKKMAFPNKWGLWAASTQEPVSPQLAESVRNGRRAGFRFCAKIAPI